MKKIVFMDLFNETIKKIKNHYEIIIPIILLFGYLPSTIYAIYTDSIVINLENEIMPTIGEVSLFIILSIIIMILGVINSTSIITLLSYPKQNTAFFETIKNGAKYIARFIGMGFIFALAGVIAYFVLFIIMMILVFVLLFILPELSLAAATILIGILVFILFFTIISFYAYFMFSPYIIIKENKGVFQSISTSYKYVKGKWKTVMKHFLLILIIILLPTVLLTTLIELMLPARHIASIITNFIYITASLIFFVFLYNLYQKISKK